MRLTARCAALHQGFIDLPARGASLAENGVRFLMSRALNPDAWHGTTILSLRKGGEVVVASDGQVAMGQTIVKSNAKKVRRLGGGGVIACFAGTTADAITLFERLEGKLEQYSGQLTRACFVFNNTAPT